MERLNEFGYVTAQSIMEAAQLCGTPVYLYDERQIIERCHALKDMPNAYGITVRFAMKAHSTSAILKTIANVGLKFDASSLNEVRRAHMAGVPYSDIILTAQEIQFGSDRSALQDMMLSGLKYNVCSLRQLELIADFAVANNIPLAIRIHPGVGSGETAARNTGDDYSCFGVHRTDLDSALTLAKDKGLIFDHVHTHIGSGADPEVWRENIDLELNIIREHFPDALTVSFGGGFKEARMPDEHAANVHELGESAKAKVEQFAKETGRKLKTEIEPGTYLMANAGYAITRIVDKKTTGASGMNFLIADGGMEINTRPLLYGSRHPFYVISKSGKLVSSEFELDDSSNYEAVVVGKCCESGDAQSLTLEGVSLPRKMNEPELDDYLVIGGVGAYCSSMSLMNYNSHGQIPELLLKANGELQLIRKRQTLEQIVANEI